MPRTNKNQKNTASAVKKAEKNFFSDIKWGESYVSLILGAVVVVVAVLLVFAFVKSKGLNASKDTISTSTDLKRVVKTYEVKEGEDLWSISEKIYGTGYNWVDLAKENNLDNPSMLYVGTKLSIPEVKVTVAAATAKNDKVVSDPAGQVKGDSYTIQSGDSLWTIAIRAYGDGYRWVDIAKANNLDNPDLIFSGNVLKIPR
ncbi:LysM peptidoglycan-binding domain-containing protein [Patescibacteria group bacterium]|nr:LysM peptidoglycan-binding domain-containing protein [Patescibacteria group bacterium]